MLRYESKLPGWALRNNRDELPIRAHYHSTWWWLRKRTQILAEYRQRGTQAPHYIMNLTKSSDRPAPFEFASLSSSKTLFRYGEASWLVPLAERGQIRFTPASSYKNEQLGPARFDDELNQSTFIRGDQVTITTMDGRRIPILGNFKTTVRTNADMYVFCTAHEFDVRFFAEFPNKEGSSADAYCVIWDIGEFNRRVIAGTEKFFLKWSFHHLPIAYFDPFENGKNYISPGVSKIFDFAYQQEYRFIWLPPYPCLLTGVLDFEIGPLNDIMTIFSAEGSVLAGNVRCSAA